MEYEIVEFNRSEPIVQFTELELVNKFRDKEEQNRIVNGIIHDTASELDKEIFIANCTRLVMKYHSKLTYDACMDIDIGMQAFIYIHAVNIAKKFNPERGCAFTTFFTSIYGRSVLQELRLSKYRVQRNTLSVERFSEDNENLPNSIVENFSNTTDDYFVEYRHESDKDRIEKILATLSNAELTTTEYKMIKEMVPMIISGTYSQIGLATCIGVKQPHISRLLKNIRHKLMKNPEVYSNFKDLVYLSKFII